MHCPPAFERAFAYRLVGLLALVTMPHLALGADVEVCATCDLSSIEAGIGATRSGDTVWVHPGTYHESITLASNRHIRSIGGSGVTHWYGTATNVAALSDGTDIRIEGFTVHPWDGSNNAPPFASPTQASSRGILVSNATLRLQDVVVSFHQSSLSGAALSMSDAIVTVEASQFTDLTAITAGAIDVNRSTLVVLDTALSDNSAAVGGAVRCLSSIIESSHTHYTDNRAQDPTTDALGFGGAIRGQRCNIRSTGDRFVGNRAGLGGHVHAESGSLVTLQTLFDSGDADTGGAIWFGGSSLGINESYFQDNNATNAAGAVYIKHATDAMHSIKSTVFRQNTSGGVGGAIRMQSALGGARLSVTDSHFSNNESVTGGGALSTRGLEHVSILGTSFLNNESTSSSSGGGALRGEFAAGLGGSLAVSNSYFCKNTAGAGGALVYITDNKEVTLADNVWVENSATSAGALLVEGADLLAQNNNFLDNSATGIGSVGFLRSGDMNFTFNVVDPTPFASGAVHTSGTFDVVYSNHNLWWTEVEQSYGGTLQARFINGDDERQAEPLWVDYDPADDCLDWSFAPGVESPVFDSPDGVIGVTGGELGPTAFTDVDNDGVAQPMDCDDSDPSIYPGAVETCDAIDNDCNGLIDDIDISDPPPSAFTTYYDADNDGFGGTISAVTCRQPTRWVTNTADCDDTNRTIRPGVDEVWYDGIDQNCDNADDYDQDGDGSPIASDATDPGDCDDLDPTISPGVDEVWYDGIDQNCDGANDYDQDGDGSALNDPIPDCDDQDSSRSPLFVEEWYDGIDQDCDNADDYDQDGDGQQITSIGGSDCDDEDSTIFVDAEERWYDGIDQNCDGANDYDQDRDGFTILLPTPDGEPSDCDDEDATVFPGQIEIPNDDIDQDCNDVDFVDEDGDGFAARHVGGRDCDDLDRAINPAAEEIPYDAIDQDCDGTDIRDADGDGFEAAVVGGSDCDDDDAAISPDAEEVWYDGIDQNCDGANDYDQDGDNWVVQAGDCDDRDPQRNPGAEEQINGGVDLNCDGYAPVSRVTGTGCSSVPSTPHYWALFTGLLAIGFRRRR